ncbi:DUF7344 domain-containing protein [Halogeometricum limi]|uniref:DUF7344 domain-containing protein n=1 Tax=Halogeometricum limi TaxID=555875 RepID=A0A1I6IHK2_9EURY|nr:hypothetical protein [Halogeometricum limi]SFR66225.1 hypothetical protein SAMN04488124_3220 [Halogeometricum limi]
MSVYNTRSDDDVSLTWDAAFEALSSHRRRILLGLLCDEEEMDVATAAARIAADENDRSECGTPDDVMLSLHHAHLPILETAGLVEWDRQTNRLSLVAGVEQFPLFTASDRSLVSRRGEVAPEVTADV